MSLLDRLRSLEESEKNQANTAAAKKEYTDCWCSKKVYDEDCYEDAWDICPQTLKEMNSGGNDEIPADLTPDKILFIDTETTGLGGGTGTVAFLVGTGFLTEDGFELNQFVMRDYPEEQFMLKRLQQLIPQFDALCTFNGKTFDIPLLRDRFLMNRMKDDVFNIPHIDLLHISRSLWKMRLKKCNLTNLEEKILGQKRENDLPGSEAPERYFSYLKTGQFSLLDEVIEHNGQDVASMCVLLTKMCQLFEKPEQICFGEDLLSMGNVLKKSRNSEKAEELYNLAINADEGNARGESRWMLSILLRQQGMMADSAKLWQQMEKDGEMGLKPVVALAKYFEHNTKEIDKAIRQTELAIGMISEPGIGDIKCGETRQQLNHRYMRLLAKKEKETKV